MEYAYLSDFDLLRETRQNVQPRPWATPAGRFALDTHFKILRAHEEIDRLDVEIRRVATHLRDEDTYLRTREAHVKRTSTHLAHQIGVRRLLRGRFDQHHYKRIEAIRALPAFTGDLTPGHPCHALPSLLDDELGFIPANVEVPSARDLGQTQEQLDEMDELEREEEEEELEEELDNDMLDVLRASVDGAELDV